MIIMEEEDFNQPSPERVDLLKRLHEKLSEQGVPLHFWAACQICDLGALAELAENKLLSVVIYSAYQMVRHCKSKGLIRLL